MADEFIKGIICPKCGCRDFRLEDGRPADSPVRPWEVVKTVRGKNFIRRYRICRYCGRRVVTRETVEE